MNTKVLLAALAGGVASFLLGWLVFGILLDPWYKTMMTPEAAAVVRAPEEMIMWGIVVSNLAYGLLFAVVFSRWANISTFRGGAIAGGVIALLVTLSMDFGFFAFMKMWSSATFLFVDPIVNAVLGAVIGGVVGWVLGYNRAAA